MQICEQQRVLILAPHCDDAELGLGGTIFRLTSCGAQVFIAIFGISIGTSRVLGRTVYPEERRTEARHAAAVLGMNRDEDQVLFPISFGWDGRLHEFPRRDLVAIIEKLSDRVEANAVLLPMPAAHQDHTTLYEAAIAANRLSRRLMRVRYVGAYEYTVNNWTPQPSQTERPTQFVEITGAPYEAKIAALMEHKSQVSTDGHCWSLDAVDVISRARGLACGFGRAEVLYPLRQLL